MPTAPITTPAPYPWTTPGHAPLGAIYSAESTTFRVFAHADRLTLRLVHPGSLQLSEHEMSLEPGVGGVGGGEANIWHVYVGGDLRGWSYSFTLKRNGETLTDILDPWALLIRGGRAIVTSTITPEDPACTPKRPRPPLDPANAIIYELHVRDFTRDHTSGVRHDWRGKYLGLTQSGTVLPGTQHPTGLDHLKELGVNVLQLMPVHSFSLPYHSEYEWGYMPMDFNAPHEGYAAAVDAEAPIREFQRLICTLHEEGFRVTLDVVYNHTFERWPGTTGADTFGKAAPARLRSFMALAPTEYFRFAKSGEPSNGSGCGNEFRSDSPMGRRFLIESVKYWVHQFGIDGYRFDLMGLIDVETMAQLTAELHAIDPTIMVYGEPWAAGPTPIEVNTKGHQRGLGWGVFNDQFRDSLRGSVFKPEDPGFLATGGRTPVDWGSTANLPATKDGPTILERVKAGIKGSIDTFADSPQESINYIECHDNHTLRDRLALSTKDNNHVTPSDRERMNKLGALMLLTSQGTPFLHSGQELGRSKGGHDNTYNLGDEINNIPWTLKDHNHRLFAFYQHAIALRHAHPMFRLTSRDDVNKAIRFLDDDLKLKLPEGVVGYQVTDPTGRDEWKEAVLLFNGSGKRVAAPLPTGRWRALVDDGHFSTLPPEQRSWVMATIEIGPHAGAVLYRER